MACHSLTAGLGALQLLLTRSWDERDGCTVGECANLGKGLRHVEAQQPSQLRARMIPRPQPRVHVSNRLGMNASIHEDMALKPPPLQTPCFSCAPDSHLMRNCVRTLIGAACKYPTMLIAAKISGNTLSGKRSSHMLSYGPGTSETAVHTYSWAWRGGA